MRTSTRILAIVALAVAAGYGWALWHALSHATVHVSVHDYGLATERRLYGDPHDVKLDLLDRGSAIVATARTVEPIGYFVVVHPDPAIGDCTQHEHKASMSAESREAYARCFKAHSRWASSWATSVQRARFDDGRCRIPEVPVKVSSRIDDWWLWWVPHPHIGGTPYRYVKLELAVDTRACEVVSRRE